MQALELSRAALGRLGARATARTAPMLIVLCGIALATAAWLALATPHNGWVWYSGGDATEYWTGEWSIAHGLIPQAIVSYGLPVLYGWVPLVAGTTLLHGLPVIVLVQAIVFVPLSVVLVWAVGNRLFGRSYAFVAATIWALGPLLLLWGSGAHYRVELEQYFLAPHWAGLTNMADLPSVVAVLACAWASLRAADTGRAGDGALAGLLAGAMIAVKPANGYFVPAVAVLFVAGWRPRVAAAWAAGIVPALITLGLWKAEGLGNLPLFALGAGHREAAAAPVVAFRTGTYLQFDHQHLSQELRELQEVFWSVRLLEFLIVAGAIGALRRLPAKGAFLIVWYAGFCLVKGSSDLAGISNTTYFRLVEPGLPAFVLLTAAIMYLVPGVGRRVAWVRQPERWAFDWRPLLATLAVAGIVPLVVVAAAHPATGTSTARDNATATAAPIEASWRPVVVRRANGVVVRWPRPDVPTSTAITYLVFRTQTGNGCELPDAGAVECFLEMDTAGSTRQPEFVDHPGAGAWTYRVAVTADYVETPDSEDLMLLSGPARTAR
jgi:hypothetical protein